MIDRSTNIRAALRSRQRGFLLNPYRFGGGGGGDGSDPHWSNVVALLHFDAGYNDQTGKTWASQNTTIDSDARFGTAVRFVKTSARARVSCTHSDFILGSQDFTVEFWAKIDTDYNCVLFDMRQGLGSSKELMLECDKGQLYLWISGAYKLGPYSGVIDKTRYHYMALTRSAGTLKLLLDNALLGTTTYTSTLDSNRIWLGTSVNVFDNNSDYDLQGLLDEFRLTKGVARDITSAPTAPFPNY